MGDGCMIGTLTGLLKIKGRDAHMNLLILTSIIAVLIGLIVYAVILKMSKDHYRPMSNEQIREQQILRGLYKLPKGDG